MKALQNLPAARLLPSPNGCRTLFDDLSRFNSVVDSGNFNVISIILLLELVVKSALNSDIWNAVFALVKSRAMPLIIIDKSILDTSLKSTSGSQ